MASFSFSIKNRWTGAVMFTAELDAKYESESERVKLGLAVKLAVKARAYLAGAYLAGAYLADANLAGANLADANLADAYLTDANLADANLAGANLAGAYLAGANLAGANLADANLADANLADANLADANLADAYLAGAYLAGDLKLVGDRPFFTLGPIGSRCALLRAYLTDKGIHLRAGCFFGPLDKFKAAVVETHGDNIHAREYAAAVAMIEAHAAAWMPNADSSADAA